MYISLPLKIYTSPIIMKSTQAQHDLFKPLLTCPTLNADSFMIFFQDSVASS